MEEEDSLVGNMLGSMQGQDQGDVNEHAAAAEFQAADELPAERKTKEEDEGEDEELARGAAAEANAELEKGKLSLQGSLLCLYTKNLDPLTAVAYDMSILPRAQIGLLGAVFASSMSVGLELESLVSEGTCISYRNMFEGEILAVLILRSDGSGSRESVKDEQEFLLDLVDRAISLVVGDENVLSLCNNVNQFRRSIRGSTVLLQQILQHRRKMMLRTRAVPVSATFLSTKRDQISNKLNALCRLLGSEYACIMDKNAMMFATSQWMTLDGTTRLLLHLFFMGMDPAKDKLTIFMADNTTYKLAVLRLQEPSRVFCYLLPEDQHTSDAERLESCGEDLFRTLEGERESLRFMEQGRWIANLSDSSSLRKLLFVRRDVGLCWGFLPESDKGMPLAAEEDDWDQRFLTHVSEARIKRTEIQRARLKAEEELSLFFRHEGFLLLAEWVPGDSFEVFSYHEDLQAVGHEKECRLTAKKHSRRFVSWAIANCSI